MDKEKIEKQYNKAVLKDIIGNVAFCLFIIALVVLVVVTSLEWVFDQFGFHFMFWKMLSMLLAFEIFTLPSFMGCYALKKNGETDGSEEKRDEEERCIPFKKAFFRSLAKRYRNDPWMKSILVDESHETLLGILTGEIIGNAIFAFMAFSVKTFMFVYLMKSFGCEYGFWHMFPVVVILSIFVTDRSFTSATVVNFASLFKIRSKGGKPTDDGLKTADVADITVVDNQFDEKTVEAVDNAVKGEKKTLAESGPFEQKVEDDEKDS